MRESLSEGRPSSRAKIVQAYRESPYKTIPPTAVLLGVLAAIIWNITLAPPSDFRVPSLARVKEGTTIAAEAANLKEARIVRSAFLFKVLLRVVGGEAGLVAGDYFFPEPQNAFRVALRMAQGEYLLDPVKVTIPEGANSREIVLILKDKLQFFDVEGFAALVEGKEGYLFPDTYYFLPTEDPQVVVRVMENNFKRKIEPLKNDIVASGHTLEEIVIMASLLEEEARTLETRRRISGVLWNRIRRGMRLQVDAVFPYIIGKNTFQVTRADLMVDSPYNTYRYAGLPIGPITNPGFSSIEAAVRPIPSSYLYYLADMNGVTYFSKTYAEHLRKQRLYLGN